jgi:Ice-binding-like
MSSYVAARRRLGACLLAATTATALLLMSGATNADAAIVPTVPLLTAANYSVLAGSTVTNTGPSTLNKGLGLHPGTSVTGFPPGIVNGTWNQTDAAALQAKNDLTAAYVDAAGRPTNATTTADLTGLMLVGGVYGTTANGALGLTGTLTLDGGGNANSVFIFQTGSSLTVGSSGVVNLINGASPCNVFWQVGSSATLGSGASFVGNIMAQDSVTVDAGATIQGRALAQTAAVTLINDTFTTPTCTGETPGTATPTTTTAPGGTTVTTTPAGGGTTTGTTPGGGSTTSATTPGTSTDLTSAGPGVPGVSGPPRTGGAPLQSGSSPWVAVLFVILIGGGTGLALLRRRPGDRAESLSEH